MSIGIAIKVSDGFAIAADSASTLADGAGNVYNIYNNANKIVNLYKGLPIGMVFWDAGSIGPSSMATIAKDLRKRLTDGDPADPSWKIDKEAYTMDDVADRVKRYFYDERYLAVHDVAAGGDFPSIGMYVCGFGTTDDIGREFEITIQKDGSCQGPTETNPGQLHDLRAFASPDPVFRLALGISLDAVEVMKANGMSQADADKLWMALAGGMSAGFLHPAMPIKDASDLAAFLVHVAIMYYRFKPGHNTVGGPIELAAITKHEGFKWIDRKLYYDQRLNP